VQEELSHKLAEYGFDVVAVLIDQPQVDSSVQNSFNRVVASKRELEAAQQEAEAARIRLVAGARAEAEGQVVRAEGLAKSREILSKSLEENIKTIAGSGADVESAMNLLMAVNRFDALREVGRSGNLVLMDMQDPATAIQASVLKRVSGLSSQLDQAKVENLGLRTTLQELSAKAAPQTSDSVASTGASPEESEEADA
jgi:regulator of protease activity HflC (stomatin/prohibitin superfamily)